MTTSAWLLQFQGSLNRYLNSIKLQRSRASTDTCQQANLYKFIGNYPVRTGSLNCQQMDAYINWYLLAGRQVSLPALWIVKGLIVFLISLITCSMDPETALTFTHGQLFCSVNSQVKKLT